MEGRKNGIVTDKVKMEIAKELGVYEQVIKDGGWANVTSRDCGNIVSKAVERAKEKLK